jgi:cobaltochelatase CobS
LTTNIEQTPDIKLSIKQTFGIDSDMEVDAFSKKTDYVPDIDKTYKFDKDTTLAILSGFSFNKRVLVQGYHGTGKSTHIEQIAARLNWPCIRVNLDSHVSRIDLIGKEAIVLENGSQITKFKEGIIPWALTNGVALVFDEYDAGRPDVMFVIQRILELEGKLTLLEQNRVITPHPSFRLFCTTNTIGLGDTSGMYHGTQQINQGQMDRWNIVSTLNYLSEKQELNIVSSKAKSFLKKYQKEKIALMINLANLTRTGFKNGDISTVMSPRTVITWAENALIFNDIEYAFKVTFLNKCDEAERPIIAEYYQRCFALELPSAWVNVINNSSDIINE